MRSDESLLEISQETSKFNADEAEETYVPETKNISEVVQLKLAEQLSGLDQPAQVDVSCADWWPVQMESAEMLWSELEYGRSHDKTQNIWMDDPSFQTPPHVRATPADWTPANPLAPSNLAALWPADFALGGFDTSIEEKASFDWAPEGGGPHADFAMVLQYPQEWSQTSEHLQDRCLWQIDPREQSEFFIDKALPPVEPAILQRDEVSKVPDSPRTPKPMRSFPARSPNGKVLSTSSQQASLPATPQPRGWVPETPSPGPRTSVHWPPGPAPLPPLVLWES